MLLQLIELRLEPRRAQAPGDSLDQAAQLAADVLELAPLQPEIDLPLAVEAVHLPVELGDELLDQLRRHQPVLQPVEDQGLEDGAAQAALVAAGPLAVGRRTGEVVLADGGQRRAADPAMGQPGQEVPGAALLPELGRSRLGDAG